MDLHDHCPSCPVAAGMPCLGRHPSFPRFCDQAEGGDDNHRSHIVNRSALGLHPAARPATGAVPAATPAGPVAPITPKSVRKRIASCPYRESRCGCERPRCHHPDLGPRWGYEGSGVGFRVGLPDCERCLARLDRALPAPA